MSDAGHLLQEDQEICVLTDSDNTKVVPCRVCEVPCQVSKFAADRLVQCDSCRGDKGRDRTGESEVVQPGVTDPAKARNLADCLINPHFARAICPAHPDDPEHVMELKYISQNPRFGPSLALGDGRFKQLGPGEVVMHQCLTCKAVVTYDTTCQVQYRRQNEIRDHKHCNRMLETLGLREPS